MRKIIDIAINDLTIFLKDTGAVIGAFAVPIVMGIVLGFAFGGSTGTSQLRVDVIDHDASPLSAEFLSQLKQANETLVLCPMDNTEDDFCRLSGETSLDQEQAVTRLTDNTSLALIEIPQGFEANLESGQPVSITYRSNENAAAPSYILQAVQAVTQRMGGALVAANVGEDIVESTGGVAFDDDTERQNFRQTVYDRAAETWQSVPFSVEYHVSQADSSDVSDRQQGFGQSIPGMASMFVTFFVLLASVTIIRERKNWTIQRLVTMPLRRGQILGGKILMYFMLGMLQFTAMFVVGVLLGLSLGNSIPALVLVMVSFTLCITALAFLIGTFVQTEMQGAAMLNLLGLTLAPLGGAWWPLDIVPDFMKTVGHISPIAWAMDGFRVLLYEQGGLGDVLLPVGVLLTAAVVFFAITVMRFKYE